MRLLLLAGLLLSVANLTISLTAFGQLTEKDSIAYQASVKNALSVYHQFLTNPSGLFNGSQYISYANLIKNDHPYFMSDSMNRGNIVYDGVLFENVPMFYDLVKEQVVINDPYKIYQISLINEKVNSFTLLNHQFIRLQADSINRHVISSGFYDRLYQGKINLYEKETKKLQEVISGQEVNRIIIPQNNFYLEIAGKFYPVNRKNSLLKLLSNRKKEIQQFIRKKKLNYRQDKENTLIKVVTYYDSLPANGNIKADT